MTTVSRSCTVATVSRERPRIEKIAIARMASNAIAPTAIQSGSTVVVDVVRVVSVGAVLLVVVVVVVDCELLDEPPLCVCAGCVVVLLPLFCADTCTAHGTIIRLRASTKAAAKRERFDRCIIKILLLGAFSSGGSLV